MSDYLTEAEQIELLKKLWKEYGVPAVVGILIATVIIFGWNFYRKYRVKMEDSASLVYAHLMVDELNNRSADALTQAQILQKQFSHTPYATLAALFVAKQEVGSKQYPQAQNQLHWVVEHGANDAYRQIARIRSARVYLEQQQPDNALQVLQSVNDKSFTPLVLSVQGDAYVSQGEVDKAKVAYQTALGLLPTNAAMQPLLEMKLEALPAIKKP